MKNNFLDHFEMVMVSCETDHFEMVVDEILEMMVDCEMEMMVNDDEMKFLKKLSRQIKMKNINLRCMMVIFRPIK